MRLILNVNEFNYIFTELLNIKNLKIMAQKNEMSARALSMEEIENVNGGSKNFYCDLMEKDGSGACSKFI